MNGFSVVSPDVRTIGAARQTKRKQSQAALRPESLLRLQSGGSAPIL